MVKFFCPVKDARITSKFGWRNIGRGKEWHQGVDLAGPKPGVNVPVYACADGIVKACGPLSTYGNRVLLSHTINGKVWETNYAHLHTIKVKNGQKVKQGEVIGIMGNTGGSFGVHLHLEIHNGLYAPGQPNAVDPMKYISLSDNTSKKKDESENNVVKKEEETESEFMNFTTETTKNAVRDHIQQMVKNDYINASWLVKFDDEKMTAGDYEALKLIADQKKNTKK